MLYDCEMEIYMKDVYEFAKYFIKKGLDSSPNTYDGNMKLQKMLVFANLVSIAEGKGKLFSEDILAYKNGCVVEKVRLRYKNDYYDFKKDSDNFNPDFSQSEYEILNKTIDIFGDASAKELSEINHTFDFWKNAYQSSMLGNGNYNQQLAIVDIADIEKEIDKMKLILDAYENTQDDTDKFEIINGVKYYYDSNEIELTDKVIEELERFSLDADEKTYSIYMDDGDMVIY